MDDKVNWNLNGSTYGSTDGNVSKKGNSNNTNKDNNIKKVRNISYKVKITLLLIICIFVNLLFFVLPLKYSEILFNMKGLILYCSCSSTGTMFFITTIIIVCVFKVLFLNPYITKRITSSKGDLTKNSYNKIKKVILVSEFILILIFCASIKFRSKYASYKNGIITYGNNGKITQVKVSNIKYIIVHSTKQYHYSKSEQYYYLGVEADYFYNNQVTPLLYCEGANGLPTLTYFLNDLKKSHNFQDISVSSSDFNGNMVNSTDFKYLDNGRPPIFYFKTSINQLTNINYTDDNTIVSEKYLNERSNTKKYSDYIKGK